MSYGLIIALIRDWLSLKNNNINKRILDPVTQNDE